MILAIKWVVRNIITSTTLPALCLISAFEKGEQVVVIDVDYRDAEFCF